MQLDKFSENESALFSTHEKLFVAILSKNLVYGALATSVTSVPAAHPTFSKSARSLLHSEKSRLYQPRSY